jgi:hypothetical protein
MLGVETFAAIASAARRVRGIAARGGAAEVEPAAAD